MKPSRRDIEALTSQLCSAKTSKELSNAEIGRQADVHPSQVGRILGGQFRTFSLNVLQVCAILNIDVHELQRQTLKDSAAWLQLERSLRHLWDDTPHGARLIAILLDTIAKLRSS